MSCWILVNCFLTNRALYNLLCLVVSTLNHQMTFRLYLLGVINLIYIPSEAIFFNMEMDPLRPSALMHSTLITQACNTVPRPRHQ